MPLDINFVLDRVADADRPPHFLDIGAGDVPRTRYQQFDLNDMAGEQFLRAWKIKNPKKYPEFSDPNQEYFDVMEFNSGGFLFVEVQGWQDGSTYHSFYYDGKTTRYADGLFNRG